MTETITSGKLSGIAFVRFAMSTRLGGVSPEPYGMNLSFKVGDDAENVSSNRAKFFGSLGIRPERLALPQQCHSATVLKVETGGSYDSCDGLVTATPNLWLAVSIADCVPVMLVDPQKKVVAALHAGWRGASQHIAERGIQFMVREFGTRPSNVIAYIGPSAGTLL